MKKTTIKISKETKQKLDRIKFILEKRMRIFKAFKKGEKMKLLELVNGTLLSDASIRVYRNRYYYYILNAKDKKFLEWVGKLFKRFNGQLRKIG